MPALPVFHPSVDILQAFAFGKLSDAAASDTVLQHLETCVDCRDKVTGLSADSFLQRLRDARQRPNTPVPNTRSSDVERVSKVGEQASPPIVPDLPPELRDHGQYEVLRELGRGGMGVVYLAKNKLMDRLEVLKVISTAMVHKTGALDRFLREIRAAASLSHDNVVKAHSAMQFGEVLVFAMEYVEGDDLAQVVKTQGPLPIANACYYARQVALGLQHAHEKNMVHRDIKPQNLILARVGKKHMVKILDFGLAKATSEKKLNRDLTGDGKMLGTPDYMAPEQSLDAATADIRADIYSLGCTLYYLLTGAPPFDAGSLFALLQAHQTKDARPVNLVRPEVPVELAAVVAKMMAKEPSKRYQKPLEIAQALTPFFTKPGAKGPGTEAAPSLSLGERVKAEPRRPEVAAKRSETIAATPSETVAPPKKVAADPFAFAPEPLVQNPLAKEAKAKAKAPKRLKPLYVALGVAILGMVLWGAGVLRVKTPDGTIVLRKLPADAEVKVDGVVVTVTLADGKTFEVRDVTAKKKHWLEVTHKGVKVLGQEVEVDAGGRKSIDVRLENLVEEKIPPPPLNPDRQAAKWVLSLGGYVLVTVGGAEKKIDAVEKLPSERFELVQIALRDKPVKDADLIHLKGLTELYQLGLGNTGVSDAALTHVKGLINLKFLHLNACTRVGDAGLQNLKGLTNLEHLDLSSTHVSDGGLVHLKGLTDLKHLALYGTGVRDAGLVHLKGLANLTHLYLGSTGVSDAGLAHLEGLNKLVALSLWESGVSDAGMVHLKGLTNLEHLTLAHTKVSDTGLTHIKGLINLTALDLMDTNVSDAGMPHLAGLNKLEWLSFSYNPQISGAGMVHLKGLTNLGTLLLGGTKVSDAALANLRRMPRLRELSLHDTNVGDDGLPGLYDLHRLRELNLTNTKVTAAGIAALQKVLPDCRINSGAISPKGPIPPGAIDEKWVREVAALPVDKQADAVAAKLKDINPGFDGKVDRKIENGAVVELTFSTVGVVDLSPVRALPGLRGLYLHAPFGKSTLTDLTPLQGRKLTWLVLIGCGVRDLTPLKGMPLKDLTLHACGPVQDITSLKGMPLTHLNLHRCGGVSDAGLAHLKDLTNLEYFSLAETDISDAGLEYVKGLTNLRHLKLDFTKVGDAGLVHIMDLPNLIVLGLGEKLTDAGLARIKNLTNLTELGLSKTKISDTGLAHIKGLINLTTLELHGTDISDAGLAQLKGLTRLRELFLQYTKVGDDGLRALYGLSGLRVLDVTRTNVTAAGIAALQKALPKCNIRSDAAALKDSKKSEKRPPEETTDGFISLLKDVTDWEKQGKGTWKVGLNGVLRGQGPDAAMVTKRRDYKDFILRAELSASEDVEAFVGVRLQGGAGTAWRGMSTRVFGDGSSTVRAGRADAAFVKFERGMKRLEFKPDEPFTLEIRVTGDVIQIHTNGQYTAGCQCRSDPAGRIGLFVMNGGLRVTELEIKDSSISRGDANIRSDVGAPITGRPANSVGTKVYLSDLNELDQRVGFGGFSKNGKSFAGDIAVNRVKFPKGLSMHPPENGYSWVKYKLDRLNVVKFETMVGINDTSDGVGWPLPLTFHVLGDGKPLWSSKPMRDRGRTEECKIPIEGVQILELRVSCPGQAFKAHAVWLDPCIITKMAYLDLEPKANEKLNDEDWAELPKGEQTFGGVKFKIGEGLIQLSGKDHMRFPVKIEGIKVNTTFSKLCMLHATHWGAKDEAIVGYYTVNYDDKSQETIQLIYGKDIMDWWYEDGSKQPTRAKIGWKGDNQYAQHKGAKIRLYVTTWRNPEPARKVVSIDFGSTNTEDAAPFCLAITAE